MRVGETQRDLVPCHDVVEEKSLHVVHHVSQLRLIPGLTSAEVDAHAVKEQVLCAARTKRVRERAGVHITRRVVTHHALVVALVS